MKNRFLLLLALAAAAWPAAAQSPTPTPTPTPAPTPIPPLVSTLGLVTATGTLNAAPGSISFADPAFGGVIGLSHLPTSVGGTGSLTLPATATAPAGEYVNGYNATTGAFSFGTPAGTGGSGTSLTTQSAPAGEFVNGFNASTNTFTTAQPNSSELSDATAFGRSLLDAATPSAAGTILGLANYAYPNTLIPASVLPPVPFNNLPSSLERNFNLEAGAIDSLISLSTPGASQALYSAANDTTLTYTRNPGLWLAQVSTGGTTSPYDLTCVSVYSTSGWTYTLITEFEAITAWHTTAAAAGTGSAPGDSVSFVTLTGVTVTATVSTITRVGSTDIAVATFTGAVSTPIHVHPATVMPATLPPGYTFAGAPVAYVRQDRNLYVGDIVSLQAAGSTIDTITVPTETNRLAFGYSPNSTTTGDSSRPAFLLLGQQAVYLFSFSNGGAPTSIGPDVGANAAGINALLGGGRTLQVINLPVSPADAAAITALQPAQAVTLSGATITPNITAHGRTIVNLTVTQNTTITAPTGITLNDGDEVVFRLTENGTGGYTVTFAAFYDFTTNTPQTAIPTAANNTSRLGFEYFASKNQLCVTGQAGPYN